MTNINIDSRNRGGEIDSFGIYYLNYSKVVEIAMTVNNILQTHQHSDTSRSLNDTFSSSISGGVSTKSPILRANLGSSLEGSHASSEAERVQETYEVKHTKSTHLKTVLERARLVHPQNLDENPEGTLVRVDDLRLRLFNEEQHLQMQMLRHDALKGVRVEGLELNNLINSILQDYAYLLISEGFSPKEKEQDLIHHGIAVKIPSETSNEFENKYSIHDLQLGHVSVIGVYKGKLPTLQLESNTFNYFQNNSEEAEQFEGKIVKSELPDNAFAKQKKSKVIALPKITHYIDVIAVIQPIIFNNEPSDDSTIAGEQETQKNKRCFFNKFRWRSK